MSQREVAPEPARPHLLEIPVVWFALHLVEYAIFVGLISPVAPRTWSTPVMAAISFLVIGGLTALNYAIRRRFIPH